ncbi:MAG TPA: molybdate ABC transporter permease subunit [Rhodocyclaceae bacterium]|nr:MAG: molybdenum ABC transporter permease subunit [Betaproteobacteria bacterium CG2_30_68_42]PJA58545.1 MAG: molybdate ABC transporter permease subunit [Rhodocyclales bacterium CG_4_9_14_3_um_filter_68_10]HCX32896.1 molybdate ABC transporter permease subunit [Rhodocyclaceae bacterium]
MDWTAFLLSLRLAAWTLAILLPVGLLVARALAHARFAGKPLVEAALALPLVLPPTVLGYYLLVAFGGESALGRLYETAFGRPLVFTFQGLLLASVIFNLPFAIQPIQRAFEAIAPEIREAAECCGLKPWRIFWRIELPLAWPGLVTALVLSFAHTLGEFGVVLMVGGSIPGETRTVAIAIYDRVQGFDHAAAGMMSVVLLAISLGAISIAYFGGARGGGRDV